MDFEVTAIIVGQRSSWDEPPVRGENGDLGELGLGDDALLRVGNGHLPSKPDAGRILAASSRVRGRPRPRVGGGLLTESPRARPCRCEAPWVPGWCRPPAGNCR